MSYEFKISSKQVEDQFIQLLKRIYTYEMLLFILFMLLFHLRFSFAQVQDKFYGLRFYQ
jgi:hypothetical protein